MKQAIAHRQCMWCSNMHDNTNKLRPTDGKNKERQIKFTNIHKHSANGPNSIPREIKVRASIEYMMVLLHGELDLMLYRCSGEMDQMSLI